MSHYDAKVAGELGAEFVSVMLQDTEAYRKYRKILLKQYPNKEGMGWPTYLLVTVRRVISPSMENSRVACPRRVPHPSWRVAGCRRSSDADEWGRGT